MLFLNTTVYGLELGLCYALVALGMYIAYSILDFPDLSTDGTFPLGGVVGTVLIYRASFPPVLALFGGFFSGMIMGAITGLLHVKLGISKLLSGIIVMTSLLSGTLALTTLLTQNGFSTTNFSYTAYGFDGIFNKGYDIMSDFGIIILLLIIVIVAKLTLDLFFKTKLGFMLIATGSNEGFVTSLGRDVGHYKIFGLSLANGLVGFGGALYAQLTMNYDNTSGTGKVVLALASVIIGLALFSRAKRVKPTTAVIVGAIIYSLCLNYFTLIDTNGTYLKLMNAVCFTLILVLNARADKRSNRKRGGMSAL
jgi:putative ABC transport system permease protein